MRPKDRIYFLIDRFTEISGTVVTYDEESGKVSVRCDDDGEILHGYEEHTRPNEDILDKGVCADTIAERHVNQPSL